MLRNKQIETKPLSGFMELSPKDQIAFNYIRDVIQGTYKMFGFLPIDTPILERSEVLLAKAGGETEKQIYQFTKGNTELAMRFDLTVPLARYVAEHYNDITFPFKRYAIGKVFRGERAQAGRFREFYQCDVDIIGEEKLDLDYDAEIINVVYTIFEKLDFGPFVIKINNRKLFDGLFAELGIAESAPVMQVIDKLEKIGEKEVEGELQKNGLETEQIKKILSFINISGNTEEVMSQLKTLSITNEEFLLGVSELEEIMASLKALGIPESIGVIDLSIARGLDYYTGTVFETNLVDHPDIGSVCSGGRYDNLADSYTSKKLPGVGASIGLTRLFDQLIKKSIIVPEKNTLTKVLIVPMVDDPTYASELARTLREKEITTEISFNSKVKKAISYADKLGIPFVVFIGEDEIASGMYSLKDMETGEQQNVGLDELLEKLTL